MKIERISENQIKCTLNRSDLASRQIRMSELAYGTEKTRGLFQDMMEQASTEVGFDANDLPLMIEAIPVSMDCIVLMITKVEDPEEVDTKFSNFMHINDLLSGTEKESGKENPAWLDAVLLVVGAVAIAFGANLLVENGTKIAAALGVPDSVIGLTMVALGTSLPELITAITSLISRGHWDSAPCICPASTLAAPGVGSYVTE